MIALEAICSANGRRQLTDGLGPNVGVFREETSITSSSATGMGNFAVPLFAPRI